MGGLVSGFLVLNFGKLFYTWREESSSEYKIQNGVGREGEDAGLPD
jgi:hypothetical protein